MKSTGLGIQEMANLLKIRKHNGYPTVLLLGARAGQLFRSTSFYENMQLFSPRSFHQLSRFNQFQECYAILASNKFDETDLHSILRSSLRNSDSINSDISLATLIKRGYFDEIISTNIDDVLEDALIRVEIREGRDYDIARIGRQIMSEALYREKNHPFRVTKPFGDFVSRDYIVTGRSSHLGSVASKNFLQSLLGKDLLMVGIDPAWDQDILRIIPIATKGSLWLASEEDIVDQIPFLSDLLRARSASCVLGDEGRYDSFIPKIHNYLYGSDISNYRHQMPEIINNVREEIKEIRRGIAILTEKATHLEILLEKLQVFHSELEESSGDSEKYLRD